MYNRRTTNRHVRRSTSTRVGTAVTPTLAPEISRRVDIDPAFQIMTSDRQRWIDPFTGRSVPASLGRVAAAREYLLENEQVWRNGQPTLSIARLEYERWRLDLIQLLPNEPRLRVFGRDGSWLNPYTGIFVPSITREDGRISLKTVSKIALHLSQQPAARTGKMLEPRQLLELVRLAGNKAGITSTTLKPLDEAMEKASNVQRKMLPDLPILDGFVLAVHYKAHHGVSGDFYDIITLPDGRVMIVIGDVSGHGMQAALVVATALKTLRFVARSRGELPELLSRFNDEMKADLIPGQFITLFAATLDPNTCEMRCVRAGHHPALLINMEKEAMVRRLGKSGMAIGLSQGAIFSQTLREERFTLQPGDVLLQYTDGLVEAMGSDERQYGEARLCASILTYLELAPQQLVDGIAADVSRWANGPVGDDLTILTLAALVPSSSDITPPAGAMTQQPKTALPRSSTNAGTASSRQRVDIRIEPQIQQEDAAAEDESASDSPSDRQHGHVPITGRRVVPHSEDAENEDDGDDESQDAHHEAAQRRAQGDAEDSEDAELDPEAPLDDEPRGHGQNEALLDATTRTAVSAAALGIQGQFYPPEEEPIEPFRDRAPSETDEIEAPASS
jgi:serine phosphatase RsbU (regulator of sigma subunit)